MLEKEFQYYIENQEALVKKYNGEAIVIINNEVVGVYETELEAYLASKENYEIGTFLIQKCAPGVENYTQTFHSQVIF